MATPPGRRGRRPRTPDPRCFPPAHGHRSGPSLTDTNGPTGSTVLHRSRVLHPLRPTTRTNSNPELCRLTASDRRPKPALAANPRSPPFRFRGSAIPARPSTPVFDRLHRRGDAPQSKTRQQHSRGEPRHFLLKSPMRWLDDGTPVNLGTPCTYEFPEHPYGLFYWPPASTEEEDYLESRATFAETLVQLDLPGGGVAVVGSVEGECVHAIKIEPGLYGSYCPVPIWKRCIRAGKTAPTVARMDPGPSITVDPVVLVPGSADTLYAFAATDGSGWIEGLTPDGAFAVNDAPNNVGSIALLPYGSGTHAVVQAERDGRLVVWEPVGRDHGTLAPAAWEKHLASQRDFNESLDEREYALSTPSVGDVDGDDDLEIVVTTQASDGSAGTVFVLDSAPSDTTYAIEAQASDSDWEFLGELPTMPSSRPVLACLDDDEDDLEIVVSGAELVSGNVEADTYRLHILEVSGSGLNEVGPCEDDALVPYRSGE